MSSTLPHIQAIESLNERDLSFDKNEHIKSDLQRSIGIGAEIEIGSLEDSASISSILYEEIDSVFVKHREEVRKNYPVAPMPSKRRHKMEKKLERKYDNPRAIIVINFI